MNNTRRSRPEGKGSTSDTSSDRWAEARREMVERQLASRGLRDPAVLAAMGSVPRELFVPPELAEFAYQDGPLPIGEGQTISQPYIVALMTGALEPEPGDRLLEIGTGSGYAAAVLAEVAERVVTVERHPSLADSARRKLAEAGYTNVEVVCGDGTRGWPPEQPYDGIVVAAGGPRVPESLREQLAPGAHLVIPVGESQRLQSLVRITRQEDGGFREENLGEVRFVPLIGEQGWEGDPPAAAGRPQETASGGSGAAASGTAAPDPAPGSAPRPAPSPSSPARAPEGDLAAAIATAAEPFDGIEDAELAPLLARIGDARVVLLGEATHGTSEFYRFRARLTRELVASHGFQIVAVEADWPDAARIDHWVRHAEHDPAEWQAFSRFPTWMWRNREVRDLVDWLREHNRPLPAERRAGFYGLDMYSLYTSIDAVLRYLDDVDPDTAEIARQRYGCLSPWEGDPATYGRAALGGRYRDCEGEVSEMLQELLDRRMQYVGADGERFLDAVHNARLVASAEKYYKIMYYGGRQSWNLRDQHMFDTLKLLLASRQGSRAVVWEHNSHVGDASATEMGARGEHNVGQLCRAEWGDDVHIVGFGTDHGTVAAATHWDGEMEVKTVRPSHERSYEHLAHRSGVPRFVLDLAHPGVHEGLLQPRLERAIGVIYRPETELASHYFQARLPRQFDDWVWFDESSAVTPLVTEHLAAEGLPETYPFGV